jgi:hypothetical protein
MTTLERANTRFAKACDWEASALRTWRDQPNTDNRLELIKATAELEAAGKDKGTPNEHRPET